MQYTDRLTEIGLRMESNAQVQFEKLHAAFLAYFAEHKHLNIPTAFVVPEFDGRYPENTWGIPLGRSLRNIEFGGNFAEFKETLKKLGIVVGEKKQKQPTEKKKVVVAAAAADAGDE